MKLFSKIIASALLAAGVPVTAAAVYAQDQAIVLKGNVRLVKVTLDDGGENSVELVDPDTIVPGDKLIFTTAYSNTSAEPVQNFVVTNPVPPAVRLAADTDADLIVSVDDGQNWGRLADLSVEGEDGAVRAATHADVTHIRWTLATVAPGEKGQLEYSAIIR
ncbi:DUF11 domain-containing protein [Erythrobacter sp. SD-21]|uniref:DUF11 domain-containing protein n=1 Tax=Erythrobacter sp. SD-21 TaxID=161528 RepID=UPI000153FA17|nr:DUF11 domain-containing protein [Erythrobacter sp. SD-21]EDL49983.1 hypothetical protein ED21_25968 [Erythrobacter sp. SD-21]